MTTLIKQKTGSDCFLAALAMALGATSMEDVWTQEDIDAVVQSKGVGNEEPWMTKVGLIKGKHYKRVSLYYEDTANERIRLLLWKRRAMISVQSLNIDGGHHMIYWDGEKLYDPSPKTIYNFLSSAMIHGVILFDDSVEWPSHAVQSA